MTDTNAIEVPIEVTADGDTLNDAVENYMNGTT